MKSDMINKAKRLDDLRAPPNNRLEKLEGDLLGKHSIRINDQWRIIFKWEQDKCGASEVKIIDYYSADQTGDTGTLARHSQIEAVATRTTRTIAERLGREGGTIWQSRSQSSCHLFDQRSNKRLLIVFFDKAD